MTDEHGISWKAGAAHVVANPPAGLDLVGYLRRWRASEGNGQPLEVNVLVTESRGHRAVIVTLDAPSVVGSYAAQLRTAAASAVGCPASAVLVNASHTHCAPALPGHLKTGGSTAFPTPGEIAYAQVLFEAVAEAASLAVSRLSPCRTGFAAMPFDGGVNRRQRTPDGQTIMGWNPKGPTDPDVAVVRIESLEGTPVCTVISYSCHPTVLGPEILNSSSDFVGPLRTEVRRIVGGECLFLQGTAGNIFPLEAVHDEEGPEVQFGTRMAHIATCAWDRAATVHRVPMQTPYKSAVDVAIWRMQPSADQPALSNDTVEMPVSLPLMELPTATEMERLRQDLQATLEDVKASGAPRDAWNPVWLHTKWVDKMLERLSSDPQQAVPATVSATMLGHVLVIALPCEPFCELGLAIKAHFKDVPVIVLGYTNDMVGYVAPASEYPYGGYEPWIAPRHFDQPAPFATHAADVLIATAIDAGERLLGRDSGDHDRKADHVVH